MAGQSMPYDPAMLSGKTAQRITRVVLVALAIVAVMALSGGLGVGTPFRSSSASAAAAPDPVGGGPSSAPLTKVVADGESDGQPAPDKVTVGMYILDIQGIDLQLHRYQIDFYVWFRWTNPDIDPGRTFEFMNGSEQWGITRTPFDDEPIRLEDGTYYYREHVQSMFNTNMPLEDYPYDRLTLEIIMEDVDATSDELIYVLDDPSVESAPDLTVPGYLIHRAQAEVVDWEYPELGHTGTGATLASRLIVTIPMTRPWIPYTLKIFVPLALVLLCASIIFLISPQHVDARFGLGISALLTLIALKWTTDGEMPLMDYLGLVDSIYIVAFGYIALGLADTTYTTWRRGHGVDDATLQQFDRKVFVVSAGFLVLGCTLIFAFFS